MPKEIVNLFRLGNWLGRIPRVDDAKAIKAPNRGSTRLFDVHPITWAGVGQQAQFRELQCLEAESSGSGPPEIAEVLRENLPATVKAAIDQATARTTEIALLHIAAEAVEGSGWNFSLGARKHAVR